MCVYSPTNVAHHATEVEEFYIALRSAIQQTPAHNFLVILEDFNARLGPEDAPFPYHSSTNTNGEHLSALLMEQGLLAANTLFRKRMGKRWTFRDRGTNVLRQLDYILVRRKWRSSVLNAEPYSSFQTVGSDHRVVTVRLRLSLRAPKTTPRSRPDWVAFAGSPEIQASYTADVRGRLLEGPQDTSYELFLAASKEATARWVPVKGKSNNSPTSRHPVVVAARARMEEASMELEREGSEECREKLRETKRRLYEAYDQVEGRKLMEEVKKVEAAHGERRYKEAWRVINDTSGRKRPRVGQLTGSNPRQRVASWYTHFQKLLGEHPEVEGAEEEIPTVLANLEIDDGPFTQAEFAAAKATMKQGKSAGPDGIPPEVVVNADLDEILLGFCNRLLIDNVKPSVWSLSNIIPVPKSGDLSKPDNYRGISLTCVMAKLFNRLVLNRIRDPIDPHLRSAQNGFRKGRSTVGQILALRRLIEEVKRNNLTAVLCFVDFRKAFDSIHRGVMIKILRAYGVPPNLLKAIETLYRDTSARVVTSDGESEEFRIHAGVLQGDTLAPFLFIVALDYALRKAIAGREEELGFTLTRRRSRRQPAVVLTDLDYADDICLVSKEAEQAQELLTRVETECAKVGLRLNAKKTEYIAYNLPAEHPPLRTVDGTVLREVNDFKYLGSWVNSTDRDVKDRRALAWSK